MSEGLTMNELAEKNALLVTEVCALQQKLDAMAADNAVLKSERAQMVEIGELIRTQNNRITDQPFFAVMTKREIVGSEDHDYDRICWVENQSGDYVEATETQHRRLEAIYQAKYEVREGWDRYAMKEIDVFVTGCFTEQGCKDFISRNAHNLNKPFIYAFGSYRNNEYQAVRKFIMDIPETPVSDAYLNSVRAEGVEMLANTCSTYNNGHEIHPDIEAIRHFAEYLRSGPHDTEDKAEGIEPAPLTALPVERDQYGYWSHPDYLDFCDGREYIPSAEFNQWMESKGMEWTVDYRDEEFPEPEVDGYDLSTWNPEAPAGNGWFVGSIHDTEDGAVCIWLRAKAG